MAIPNLDDSKRLSARRREQVYNALLQSDAVTCAFHVTSAADIDTVNILNARLKAMASSIQKLPVTPRLVFVDGNLSLPEIDIEQRVIVGGDAKVSLIAAASVVAKVIRDRIMIEEANRFPCYGFDRHVGYGTRRHLEALQRFGPCQIHRHSYKPVRHALNNSAKIPL